MNQPIENRVRILCITRELFFHSGSEVIFDIVETNLPRDAAFRSIRYDARDDVIMVKLESPSFGHVPSGTEIPRLYPREFVVDGKRMLDFHDRIRGVPDTMEALPVFETIRAAIQAAESILRGQANQAVESILRGQAFPLPHFEPDPDSPHIVEG